MVVPEKVKEAVDRVCEGFAGSNRPQPIGVRDAILGEHGAAQRAEVIKAMGTMSSILMEKLKDVERYVQNAELDADPMIKFAIRTIWNSMKANVALNDYVNNQSRYQNMCMAQCAYYCLYYDPTTWREEDEDWHWGVDPLIVICRFFEVWFELIRGGHHRSHPAVMNKIRMKAMERRRDVAYKELQRNALCIEIEKHVPRVCPLRPCALCGRRLGLWRVAPDLVPVLPRAVLEPHPEHRDIPLKRCGCARCKTRRREGVSGAWYHCRQCQSEDRTIHNFDTEVCVIGKVAFGKVAPEDVLGLGVGSLDVDFLPLMTDIFARRDDRARVPKSILQAYKHFNEKWLVPMILGAGVTPKPVSFGSIAELRERLFQDLFVARITAASTYSTSFLWSTTPASRIEVSARLATSVLLNDARCYARNWGLRWYHVFSDGGHEIPFDLLAPYRPVYERVLLAVRAYQEAHFNPLD